MSWPIAYTQLFPSKKNSEVCLELTTLLPPNDGRHSLLQYPENTVKNHLAWFIYFKSLGRILSIQKHQEKKTLIECLL